MKSNELAVLNQLAHEWLSTFPDKTIEEFIEHLITMELDVGMKNVFNAFYVTKHKQLEMKEDAKRQRNLH